MSDISGVAQVAVEANLDTFTASAVAIGNLVSDAIEFGLKKAGDFLKTLPSIGQELNDAFNTVRVQTGATGDALTYLNNIVGEVGGTSAQKLQDVGASVGILSDRFIDLGENGLRNLSTQFVNLSTITGTSLKTNVDNLGGALLVFNSNTSNYTKRMDEAFRATQVAGVQLSDIVPTLNSVGASLQGVGFNYEQSLGFVASFAKVGLDATQAQLALGKVAKLASADGVTASQEWQKLTDTWAAAKTPQAAFAEGADVLGTRAARMAVLVQQGTLNYKELTAAISDGTDTIQKATDDTDNLAREWEILKNALKVDLTGPATGLTKGLTDLVKQVSPIIQELVVGIGGAIGPAISTIAETLGPGLITVLKALEPIFTSLGNLISTVFTAAKPLIDALAGAFALLAPVISQIIDGIAGALGPAISALAPVVTELADAFLPVVQALGGAFVTVIQALAPAFVAIAQAVVPIADKLGKDFAEAIIKITPLLPQLVADVTQLVIAALQVVESGLLELFINLLPPVTQLVTWIANLTAAFLSHKEVLEPLAIVVGALWIAFQGFEVVAKAQAAIKTFAAIAEATGSSTTASFLSMQGEAEASSTAMVAALNSVVTELEVVNANLETMIAGLTALNDAAIVAAGGVAPLEGELAALNLELVPLSAEIDLTAVSLDGLTVSEDAAAASGGALEAVLAILAAPITLVVVAVAALGTAIYEAYEHFTPFHDAVDALGRLISGTFMTAWHDVSDFVTNSVIPWVKELPGDIQNLWNSFVNSGPVKAILDGVAQAGKALSDTWNNDLKPAIDNLWTSLQPAIQAFEDLWTKAILPLVGFIESLFKPVVQWMIDHWQIFAGILAVVLAPLTLVGGAIYEVATHFDFFKGILTTVLDAIGPFVAVMIQISGGIISDVINVITGLVNILTGLFTLDFGKVVDGLEGIGGALWNAFVTLPEKLLGGIWDLIQNLKIPELLGKLFTEGLPALGSMIWDAIKSAFDWVVANGPGILEAIGSWLAGLPGRILGWLGDLGSLLGGWFLDAFDWVVKNGLSLLGTLIGWILTIPVLIYRGLKDIGPKLWDAVKEGWDWVVDNGPGILEGIATWLASIPGKISGWLGDLGSTLWQWFVDASVWVVNNGPTIFDNIMNWIKSLPGKIIGWLGDLGSLLWQWFVDASVWVVTNGPGILEGIMNWIKSIPGMIIGWLGDLGGLIIGWIKSAFDWVVENGPDILEGIINWFSGLPGKIFDAIRGGLSSAGGAISDLASQLWDTIKGFINDHLISPVREFKVSILGTDYTPLGGVPYLADGAFVQRATQAIIGEAGPEVVIPLSRPKRAQQLAQESGLNQILGQGGGGGNTIINVTVEATPDTTAAQATMVGQTAGQAIRRAIEPAVRNG